jgi:hypothetical protein
MSIVNINVSVTNPPKPSTAQIRRDDFRGRHNAECR